MSDLKLHATAAIHAEVDEKQLMKLGVHRPRDVSRNKIWMLGGGQVCSSNTSLPPLPHLTLKRRGPSIHEAFENLAPKCKDTDTPFLNSVAVRPVHQNLLDVCYLDEGIQCSREQMRESQQANESDVNEIIITSVIIL